MFEYFFSKFVKKARGRSIRASSIPSSSKVESGSTVLNSSFGAHSFCGYDCSFINCEIGRFCSIAGRVIVGGARHPIEYVSTSPVFLAHKESISEKFSRHDYRWEARTIIGDDVWIGEGAWIDNLAQVKIGSNCCISQGAMLLTGNHNYKKPTFDLITKGITLEEGAWVGAKAVVCPGVTCESHSVLSVGSIAVSSLEPYWIYQGNPAIKVKERVIA